MIQPFHHVSHIDRGGVAVHQSSQCRPFAWTDPPLRYLAHDLPDGLHGIVRKVRGRQVELDQPLSRQEPTEQELSRGIATFGEFRRLAYQHLLLILEEGLSDNRGAVS